MFYCLDLCYPRCKLHLKDLIYGCRLRQNSQSAKILHFASKWSNQVFFEAKTECTGPQISFHHVIQV
uniref:Ovule protein n=1 Tax=Panagrolaimus sp. JU765 TaxID=591449 RepID=A0AC34QM66_9BILA